ncbi:hypothetical protein [Pseudomonas sp. GOM6]|uniref:hypothetical protein n=1 Tax=Pseudomonas sp. GOM6 TaxID=3036944 RepID=UPI002409F2F9|nr:hypothetical protein [Pseudomonas sp. GOM6]MDG1581035.1 hypothetical protein [Pseudomonas sp. GOM6]
MKTLSRIALAQIIMAAALATGCSATPQPSKQSGNGQSTQVFTQQVIIVPNCQTVAGTPVCQWIEPSLPNAAEQPQGRQQKVKGIML